MAAWRQVLLFAIHCFFALWKVLVLLWKQFLLGQPVPVWMTVQMHLFRQEPLQNQNPEEQANPATHLWQKKMDIAQTKSRLL